MQVHIVVAMTKDRVMGDKGTIPWTIKEDMKLFKEITTGNTVIMGKNTWDSLPAQFRPLPNRTNIVVSRTMGPTTGAIVCKSVEEALTEAKKLGKEIHCIGGAQLYTSMMPYVDILHISWVKKSYTGETKFPDIDFSEWKETDTKEYTEFVYKRYERK